MTHGAAGLSEQLGVRQQHEGGMQGGAARLGLASLAWHHQDV